MIFFSKLKGKINLKNKIYVHFFLPIKPFEGVDFRFLFISFNFLYFPIFLLKHVFLLYFVPHRVNCGSEENEIYLISRN